MKNLIWQVTCRFVRPDNTADELNGILTGWGIDPRQIVEQTVKGRQEILVFPPDRKRARNLYQRLKSFEFPGVKFSIKSLKKADWQDRWKKGIRTFRLTRRFDVVPGWTKTAYRRKNRTPVYIDTNLAFGTGLHETTRFMALLIEECAGKFETFLDVGSGSGILAIIGYFCGAKEISAFDIDRQSLKVARENFKANKVKKVRLLCADLARWKSGKKFDFVAANLVTDDLIDLGKKLVDLVKPGQYLAVSGISVKNLSRFQKVFSKYRLKKIRVLRGQDWSAILFQK